MASPRPRVLVLGHTFIRHLSSFIQIHRFERLNHSFSLSQAKIHLWGLSGFTVQRAIFYRLTRVESFRPDIVVLELGTNDLTSSEPEVIGSMLEELVRVLHVDYGVKVVGVTQIIFRANSPVFNACVPILNRYLKVVLEPLPFAFFWHHRGFWHSARDLLHSDGIHLNSWGHLKLYLSMRGAILKALSLYRSLP